MTTQGISSKATQETKNKMSDAQNKRWSDQSARERCRQRMTGHTLSPEAKARISVANKGRVRSDETKAKIKAARANQVITPEHKAAISVSLHRTYAQRKQQ